MLTWIDEPTWVLVEFDSLHLNSCCPHESWWQLTDPEVDRRKFRVTGPLEEFPELEPYFPGLDVTPKMFEAWERFCAWMGRDR